MIGVVSGGVSTAAVVAVLAAGGGITGMFAVEAVTAVLTLTWVFVLVGRLLDVRASPGRQLGAPTREMLRFAGISSIGVALTLVVWNRFEFFFLNHYSSDSQIGFYSIAFAAITALMVIPKAISGTLVPAVATLQGAGELDRVRTGYARALRLSLTVTFVLTAAAAAIGPELLKLVYGTDFSAAGPLLLIMVAPFPAIAIFELASSMVSAMGHLRVVVIAGGVGAAVDIALAFALIPRYDAVGAAISNSIAQLIVGVPPFVFSRRLVGGFDWELAPVAAAATAAAAGGLAAWACVYAIGGIAGIVVGLIVGLLVFCSSAVLFAS